MIDNWNLTQGGLPIVKREIHRKTGVLKLSVGLPKLRDQLLLNRFIKMTLLKSAP
ncbi:MAG: hypothetical protein ACI8Y9_000316 [Paracoccaceae bacterium]|jgi:hypothetical protein